MKTRIMPANRRSISESPDLPDLSPGVQVYFQPLEIGFVFKENVNGRLQETPTVVKTMGVRITQTPQQLAMKPEGQRTWKWSDLFILPEPRLKPDDLIHIRGVKYRIMSIYDQSEYGFTRFDVYEDFSGE